MTTTQLESGATVAWRDSLVRLDDGTTGHLFFAVFRPEPGAAYRLDIRRPDGRGTSAVTRVPDVRDARIEPPAVDSLGNLKQTVFWPGAGFVTELTLRYQVIDRSTGDSAAVALPYAPYGERFGQGWRIIIQLERDYRLVLADLKLPQRDSLLILRGLDLEIEQLSPEWTAPEDAANVTGGYGFFGAVGRFSTEWTLDTTTARSLGYFTPP